MNKIFMSVNGMNYTYAKLISDLDEMYEHRYYVFYKNNDPYKIFKHIIHSLIHDYEIEIIDGDLSKLESIDRGIDYDHLSQVVERVDEKRRRINTLPEITEIESSCKNWRITLHTSGTVGKPKRISHYINTFVKNIKCTDRHSDDIWAFAYNPTHIAGIQVFFQAFFNKNSIIYSFADCQKMLGDLLEKYNITHISATPTYYRNTLIYLNKSYPLVKRVTFGGEKYDASLEGLVRMTFPNSKILNIYASTETGSLFVGQGEFFESNEIIQRYTRITEEGELRIHRSLLEGSTVLQSDNDWYSTGDIVEFSENKIRFITRKSELINVGGYMVNPTEIESILRNVDGVLDLVIRGETNRFTNNIIVADVIKTHDIDELVIKNAVKQYAKEHLQSWKVPRIINIVQQLGKTRSGKRLR
ncbi:hypothetical protein QW71_05285 [Paenibacillus sp. IHB B 3415]|uniref:AMP-binding protein n=1 Tax=Paenibacillus sp. IHB B 3415 TaxID=867080 RepID=UPI000573DCF0|nr:AMP-binding protein [Paenibacillus sp. IHB B 3415]KHL96809.1 hypothetical protein QW71_05285 [Paenibacillus sp. IHB B 3415]